MTTLELDVAAQATVNGSGVATTTAIGPSRYLEEWSIERYSISLTNGTGSVCRVYEGYVDPTRQRDYTQLGEGDTAAGANLSLRVGDKLVVQWTGATNAVGQVATITFQGTIKLPNRRIY